ncbi:MAG: sodium:proton antiporter NhaD [Lewinella sp.]|nr:sodium:proton antiporter NhaD [Lewinella sp.]
MYVAMSLAFVLGYSAIALEHPLKLDKAASALFTAVVLWVLFTIGKDQILPEQGEAATHLLESELLHHLGEISSILFFLLGAMTIVELVDVHGGFSLLTSRITTLHKGRLLVILSVVTFFMSAALDNLTTSIVMATLLRKLINDPKDLWIFAGMVIIAANAGGAWSPIGDVTTIMLWIGGQVTAANIVLRLLVPSFVCLAVPLAVSAYRFKGQMIGSKSTGEEEGAISLPESEQRLVLILGIGALLFVPVFKSLTHLPPFMGVLFGLSVLWGVTEFLHRNKDHEDRRSLSIAHVLERVDTPSILFFLGILLAVAALQSAGQLAELAGWLDAKLGNIWLINVLIGFLSSVVDNVPLVAGAIGMYDMGTYPPDHLFWELLAYCAGTGGSVLIIGSAAGVAIMGILKIDFIWYLKHISLLAVAGYLAGVLTFWLMNWAMG